MREDPNVKAKNTEEVSLRGFLRFMCEHLRVSYEAITDTARKQPVISKDTVANALVGATVQGARSVREADFLSASPVVREVLGRRVPDSTLCRVVGGFQGTERLLARLWRRLRAQGKLGIDGQHVGVIDGTSLGGHLTSVLAEVGQTPALVATAPIPGTGNELSASLGLLKRLAPREKGSFHYVLGDGLYACEGFWKACQRLRCFGLVKSSEERPFAALEQARQLFDHPIRGRNVGYQFVEDLDLARAIRYRIWQTTALWADTRRRLTVARIQETFLKEGRTECFWVFCQNLAIEPRKLRQLAHARWFIENNVFRAFNMLASSKHQFSRTPQIGARFTHLQALAFMALAAYRCWLEARSLAPRLHDHGRIPLRLLQSVFRLVLSPVNSS